MADPPRDNWRGTFLFVAACIIGILVLLAIAAAHN